MIRSVHLNKTADSNLNELVAGNSPKVSVSKYISELIEKEYERKENAKSPQDNDGIQEQRVQSGGEQDDNTTTEVE